MRDLCPWFILIVSSKGLTSYIGYRLILLLIESSQNLTPEKSRSRLKANHLSHDNGRPTIWWLSQCSIVLNSGFWESVFLLCCATVLLLVLVLLLLVLHCTTTGNCTRQTLGTVLVFLPLFITNFYVTNGKGLDNSMQHWNKRKFTSVYLLPKPEKENELKVKVL